MKPKIITGEEVVGYYWSGKNILSKKYNELSEDEQQDYLTEDDDRKYIYIDTCDGNFDSFTELYYTKESLIESYIEDIKFRIGVRQNIIVQTEKEISNLEFELCKYYEMKTQIMLGE